MSDPRVSDLAAQPVPTGLWYLAFRSRNLVLGAALTLVFVAAALVSLIWTPFDITVLDISNKIKSPSLRNPLGTDHFGRDILSMIMVGAQTSIAVALVAVGIGVGVGVPLGLAAAAMRGSLLDEVIMRGNDLIFAFPSLVIAILITAVFGPGAVNAIIAIGIFNVPVFARLSRGAALSLWARDFVMAAQVAGKSAARISAEHILPNILNLLIVQGTIQFSLGILAEAGLSYVGLGAQPPTPSWGGMLSRSSQYLQVSPAVQLYAPGLAIALTVRAINALGDSLRDSLDPVAGTERRTTRAIAKALRKSKQVTA